MDENGGRFGSRQRDIAIDVIAMRRIIVFIHSETACYRVIVKFPLSVRPGRYSLLEFD